MSQKEAAEWQSFETAPQDGTALILWIFSQKGFQDITSMLQRDNGGGPTQKTCYSVLTLYTDGCCIRSRLLSPERNNHDRSRNRDQA